jgi:hypothetical protein
MMSGCIGNDHFPVMLDVEFSQTATFSQPPKQGFFGLWGGGKSKKSRKHKKQKRTKRTKKRKTRKSRR